MVEKYRKTSEENGNLASELTNKLENVDMQMKKIDVVKKEEVKAWLKFAILLFKLSIINYFN